MLRFVLVRCLNGFLVLVGIIIIVFLLFNVMPDPGRMMLGQRADGASIQAINKDLGRDLPITKRFILYINDLSPISWHNFTQTESHIYADHSKYGHYTQIFITDNGNGLVLKFPYLRRSYQSMRRVSEILWDAFPGTLVLAFSAMFIGTLLGIILGIFSAVKKGTYIDKFILFIASAGVSMPSFFAGLIIAWLFAVVLHRWTGLNWTGSLYHYDPFEGRVLDLKNLILPSLALGIRPLAVIVQLTRNSMLEVLQQDYIRTAKAKGLHPFTILRKHALKNAMNPVVTTISGWFASLLAGAFFVETIFNWHGIGKVTVDALTTYDFPVVMGAVLFVAVIFVVLNILVDLIYAKLDPRVALR